MRSSSRLLNRLATVLALTVSLGTVALVTAISPSHASSDESAFVADVNHSRAQHGLKPLSVSSSLTSVARKWSQHMASGGCGSGQPICHNPNLTSQVHGWQKIGENVGVGPDENSIEDAFMNSEHHRANILDPDFTLIGVGTARGSDGRLYVTQDFEKPQGSSSSSGSTHHSSSPTHKSSSPSHKSSSGSTTHKSSSSGSSHSSSPVLRPAPRAVLNPLAARMKTLNARPVANDPVGQAVAFRSAVGALAG